MCVRVRVDACRNIYYVLTLPASFQTGQPCALLLRRQDGDGRRPARIAHQALGLRGRVQCAVGDAPSFCRYDHEVPINIYTYMYTYVCIDR